MTEFEYLAVFISIILGLGVTHLLLGLGHMIHHRSQIVVDRTHLLWTATTFLILVLNWWVFFQWQTFEVWTFDVFLLAIIWAVLIYLMVVVLFPPGVAVNESYGEVFEQNRRWFLCFWVAATSVDIGFTAIRGELTDPPLYLPFLLHLIVLGIIGIFVEQRKYQIFLAGYALAVTLAWVFLVRRLLPA